MKIIKKYGLSIGIFVFVTLCAIALWLGCSRTNQANVMPMIMRKWMLLRLIHIEENICMHILGPSLHPEDMIQLKKNIIK